MAKKLYVEDPYMKTFEATVVKIIDGTRVVLDQTCFYPEGGGQVGDRGMVGGIQVVDTQYEIGEIVHVLEKGATFKEGDKVPCEIDWERRYRVMKLHSASHIMEYFLFKVFGTMERLGSNVNERRDSSTYAYSDRLDPDRLNETNQLVNDLISKNLEITTWSSKEDPDYRFWKCGEIEEPCGGTHPKNTSEIGKVKLKRENPGSGKERVATRLVEE